MNPTNKIPFKKINLGNSLELIKPLIESGFIGLGNGVYDTEKALATYVGAKEVVLLDSCTSALFLALKYDQMKAKGNLTISAPSMTVPLAVNAVLEAGCNLVFDTRTSWVGRYYQMVGSTVVDSAHELRRNQYPEIVKEFGEDAKLCFSFYPTKTIGSADGGAIATNDSDFAQWVRSAATYGRNQGTKYQNSWDYDVNMIGYKRHYTNLQAAIVMEQLKRLDETNAKRQSVVARYNEAFGLDNKSDYLYRIEIENGKRDEFIQYMLDNGVECGVHFKPLHLMTPFSDIEVYNNNFPNTEGAKEKVEADYAKTVSLPLYDLLTDEEVERVIDLTNKFIANN